MTTSQTHSRKHPIVGCAAEVEGVVKSVAGLDPAFMGTSEKGEALLALERARDLVEALRLRVLADADDVAEEDGCRDVAAWLAPRARVDRPVAAGTLRTARGLAQRWRLVEQAAGEGAVTCAQARVVVRCLDRVATALAEPDPEGGRAEPEAGPVLARAEAEMVRLAGIHTPSELERLGERILTVIAPEVGEEADRRALERADARASAATRLSIRRRGDGSSDLSARIPDHAAARLKTYLEAFTSPRVDALDGHLPGGVVDEATGQRLPADRLAGAAFVALLESVDPDRMPDQGSGATTLVVTIDLAALQSGLGEAVTGDGTTITASQARRLACKAGIIPAVLGAKSQTLDLGRKRRLFTSGQRLALARQHRTCRAQGCSVPAAWCEAHHDQPWSEGGRTDLANATLLCSWHHHRVHDSAYRTDRLPDGGVRFRKRT
jgi:hypothetical protein